MIGCLTPTYTSSTHCLILQSCKRAKTLTLIRQIDTKWQWTKHYLLVFVFSWQILKRDISLEVTISFWYGKLADKVKIFWEGTKILQITTIEGESQNLRLCYTACWGRIWRKNKESEKKSLKILKIIFKNAISLNSDFLFSCLSMLCCIGANFGQTMPMQKTFKTWLQLVFKTQYYFVIWNYPFIRSFVAQLASAFDC